MPNRGNMKGIWAGFSKTPLHDMVSWTALFSVYWRRSLAPTATRCGLEPSLLWGMYLKRASVLMKRSFNVLWSLMCLLRPWLYDAKCRNMEYPWRVFNRMPWHNEVTYTTTVNGYAMHQHGKEGHVHLERMWQEGFRINDIMVVCQLLSLHHGSV